MSSHSPLPPYGQRPPGSPDPLDKSAGIVGKSALFILQVVLGFLGTVAYYGVIFFLTVVTVLDHLYEVPQSIPKLIFLGGSGLAGVAVILFLTLYFHWWGVLAGAMLAFLVSFLLIGPCLYWVFGVGIFVLGRG